MKKSYVRQLIESIQDENTSIAEDGTSSAEWTGFIDTGSYIFNAQLSGSLFGGVPNTKCLVLAGEQAVGKTFFALGIVKSFLQSHDNSFVVWYLAESAVTKKMLDERGIDSSRIIMAEPITVLDWANHVVRTIDAYMETEEASRPPMMIVLDSLGALSSEKEVEDLTKGIHKRDMTRQQNIRGSIRVIEKKVARAKVPTIITNHVYDVIGSYVPTKEISGGGGVKYFSDLITMLSSAKERDDDKDVIGTIIKSRMYKNRIAKPHTMVAIRLSFQSGLDRYYGLVDLGEKHGIIVKDGNKYRFPDGAKAFEKAIYKDPEKYFTKSVMDALEEAAKKEFEYGKGHVSLNEETDADDTA